jgi:hypothetical protein
MKRLHLPEIEWSEHYPLVIAVFCAILLLAMAGAMRATRDTPSSPLSDRLVSQMKGLVTHEEYFTTKNLTDKHETSYDMQGDGEMSGYFQLEKLQVDALLASESFLRCPKDKTCKIEKEEKQPGMIETIHCENAQLARPDGAYDDDRYSLCVDTSNNQAWWTYTWN